MYEQSPVSRAVRRAGIVFVLLMVLSGVCPADGAEKEGFQFRRDQELQQVRPKRPVKIKLKRTVKGEYSWELSGDDADEILKTDAKLRQQLVQPGRGPAR